MKKLILTLFALCLALCLCAGLVSCKNDEPETPPVENPPVENPPDQTGSTEPTEYTVTYVYGNGAANTVVTVPVGGYAVEPNDPQRENYRFDGWYEEGSSEVFNFSEPIRKDTVLTAHWIIPEPETVVIRWMASESTDYLYDAGVPRSAKVGDTVRFRLRLSPYYEGTPIVTAGGETLTQGMDGYYSFVVKAETMVSVSGRSEIHTPIQGLGTSKSPYIISNASQLKDFTDAVNSTSDERYNKAYIRLDADLDLAGEVLMPIGSVLNYGHFAGNFDGNGHTISNFSLAARDGICGFFGYLVTGDVYGLTLNGVTLDMEANNAESNYIIGGVVAYSIGGTITDCHVQGDFTVYSTLDPETNSVFVGGVVGFMQGYRSGYTGEVSFCTADVDVHSTGTHSILTVGGIAASTYGASESATAMVFNCTYNGDIEGKTVYAGGIVGYLRDLSGVANCFTSGSVHAEYTTDFAAAGAIVGLAFNETAVSFCYSTATVSYRSSEADSVTRGTVVGASYVDGASGIDDRAALVYKCYYSTTGSVSEGDRVFDLTKGADVLSLLGWTAGEWSFSGATPVPEPEGYAESATEIRFDFKGQTVTRTGLDGTPVSQEVYVPELYGYTSVYWLCGGAGKNTFTSDAGLISYGYFLDEALTQRLPAAMLMTEAMTVYVGFADYSEAAGEYYLDIIDTEGKVFELRLVFDDNGKMTMYYDGRVSNRMYTYDGTHLMIENAYFAYIKYPGFADLDLDLDFYARHENGTLLIYENILFTEEDGSALVAYPKNKAMGTWYTGNGGQYTFYADGTGFDAAGGQFLYTCSETGVTINRGTSILTAQFLNNGLLLQSADGRLSLSKYDAFCGTWEGNFSEGLQVYFDGAGHVRFGALETTYTISGNTLTFEGYTATFNQNGLLVLTETATGVARIFGLAGGCMGIWQETYLNYTVQFGGIGKEGYGRGIDSNGVEFTYRLDDNGYCYMYYGLELYGYFEVQHFSPDKLAHFGDGSETLVLALAVYTPSSGYIVDDYSMCYMDGFYGTWYGEDGLKLEFNGLGAYDFRTEQLSAGDFWFAVGEVIVTGSGTPTKLAYRVDLTTGTASFVYGGKTYTVSLTASGLSVAVSGVDTPVLYAEPDEYDGMTFVDEAGTVVLSFNGRSLVGKGEVIISAGGTTVTYTYTVENGVVTIYYGNTVAGTAEPNSTTGWLDVQSGGETLQMGLFHELIGTEYLGAEGLIFRVDSLFDLTGFATGTLGDSDVLVYYIDANTVAIYLEGGTFLYYVVIQDSNNIGFFDESSALVTVFTVADGYEGIYTAANGDTLELDGRSGASQYLYASATLTVTEDDETVTYYYVYEIEDDVLTIYELDRSGETDEMTPVYEVTEEEKPGAIAFEDAEGRTLYLVKLA